MTSIMLLAMISTLVALTLFIPVDSGGVPLGDTDSLTDVSVKPSQIPQELHELVGFRGFTYIHIYIHLHGF